MNAPTPFFAYESLTFPDVAALPRDTPLILPLGNGYNLERLADALGRPAQEADEGAPAHVEAPAALAQESGSAAPRGSG